MYRQGQTFRGQRNLNKITLKIQLEYNSKLFLLCIIFVSNVSFISYKGANQHTPVLFHLEKHNLFVFFYSMSAAKLESVMYFRQTFHKYKKHF